MTAQSPDPNVGFSVDHLLRIPADGALTGTHFMTGDHACAEGALYAGCRFFGGYPITPATEIAERMARRLPTLGGTYIQMEDEIASMASILGASVAGRRSMTATSGPGFSLMMENIGLGMMMEVPCVVANVQRGGPSTGLPTSVGQQDMLQARWGSHGDYGAVAVAPESVQESFDLTVKAFNIAERFRLPVFVMLDEVVGHMRERIDIPEFGALELWERPRPSVPPGEYKAYRPGPEMVPEMAITGQGYRTLMTGLTHDETGNSVTTPEMQELTVPRLREKLVHNLEHIQDYELDVPEDSKTLVISYGISARSARRAVRLAREAGHAVGFLRPRVVWPFPETALNETLASVDHVIVVEINAGQVVMEVERLVAGRAKVTLVGNPGGRVIRPAEILPVITGGGA